MIIYVNALVFVLESTFYTSILISYYFQKCNSQHVTFNLQEKKSLTKLIRLNQEVIRLNQEVPTQIFLSHYLAQ